MLLSALEPITGLVDQREINGIRQIFNSYVGIGCFGPMSRTGLDLFSPQWSESLSRSKT